MSITVFNWPVCFETLEFALFWINTKMKLIFFAILLCFTIDLVISNAAPEDSFNTGEIERNKVRTLAPIQMIGIL